MKIINQTRQEHAHAVMFMVECSADEALAKRIFAAIVQGAPRLRAKIVQEMEDAYASLIVQELPESIETLPKPPQDAP